jgi:Domain of unknown function (DUF4326)
LSRGKGFDLQRVSRGENGLAAVVVARPSRWGNPFRVEDHGREEAIRLFEQHIKSAVVDLHSLRGKNLACWCALDVACHADVLLRLANHAGTKSGEA